MISCLRASFLALLSALSLLACATTPSQAPAPTSAVVGIQVPIEYYKLANGLKVVLSQNATSPTVTVGVYYHIGLRLEPKGRTGFAHLFEHLMYEGSANLGKGEFDKLVQGSGGVLNGSTRFDYTNYFQVVPAHTLEAILWAEADRMKGLAIGPSNLEQQRGVVKNEVKVNVLNRPYGGFPWLSMPQYANENWYNAHNFYGDLSELDAATLEDAEAFFDTYYAPNNAALVIVGDFETAQARAWVDKHFGAVPARELPPKPDISEPPQTREKRHSYTDALAPRPALALGWHVPPRGTPEHFAFGLLDQILLQGQDSALWQRLVQQQGYASAVGGGINLLGDMFTYDGPMLFMAYLIHDPKATADTIIGDIDQEIARLQAAPPSAEELERALTKIRAGLYGTIGSSTRFDLVELLACFTLFDDDPARINQIEAQFRAVTPEMISQVARDYLRPENRTVLIVEPGQAAPGGGQ